MAAERLEAEGGGGGHAVTGRSHGDVQSSMRRAALFLVPAKKEFYFRWYRYHWTSVPDPDPNLWKIM
jgi:hypothetical protein